DVRRYFSNRTFLTLASGGFHLTGYVPGLETMFDDHRHLVWYRSDDECLDLIAHYLDRPAERAAIAAEGQRHVRERYPLAGQVRRLPAPPDGLHVASWARQRLLRRVSRNQSPSARGRSRHRADTPSRDVGLGGRGRLPARPSRDARPAVRDLRRLACRLRAA